MLRWVVRGDFSEERTLELRAEWKLRQVKIENKSMLGKENSKCKGPV